MPVGLTVQQKQAISEYRQQNNISSTVSDEQIIQKMIKSGKLPACFSSLAVSKTSNHKNNEQIFTKNTNTQPASNQNETEATKIEKQLTALGLTNRNGAGEKIKIDDQEFTIIGEATNGRKIVQDSNKQIQVISHDNKILDKNYVLQKNATDAIKNNSQIAQNTTLKLLDAYAKKAEISFQDQLAKDGWAGDLADGISILWGSDNRASKVSKDLDKYKKDIEELRKAAEQGDKKFNEKFKKMFGVEFNQQAIADYIQNPSEENYKKAFGTKNNITERVEDYNKSQQTGASVVKGTATVGAGIAIGVATGGTGLVGLGAAAAATGGASAVINVSDRLTSDVGLQEGELQDILVSAAWDGASVIAGGAVGKVAGAAIKGSSTAAAAGRTAINVAGDVAMGTAQELAETGTITAEGVIINAAMGGVGGAAESGILKAGKNKIKGLFNNNTNSKSTSAPVNNTPNSTSTQNLSGQKKSEISYIREKNNDTPDVQNSTNTPDNIPETKNPSAQVNSSNSEYPAIDNFLAKNGNVTAEELEAFEEAADDIIDKAYSQALENPKETLDKLEQAYKQTENKNMLNMINIIRKNYEKAGIKVSNIYTNHHAKNENIEKIITSSQNMDKKTIEAFLDLDQTLGLVEDPKVKDLINEQLEQYIKANGKVDEDFLFHLQSTVDTVNAYNGHYSAFKAEDYDELSAMARFSKMEIPFNGKFIEGKNVISGDEIDKFSDQTKSALQKDFETENKLYPMRQYFKDNVSPDKSYFNSKASSELSDHLYDNYYLKELEKQNVAPEIIQKCKELNEKLGVKVMIPANQNLAPDFLDKIDTELTKWQKASNGQAQMPPVIDFSTVKTTWFGEGAAGGYSEADFNGSLAFNPSSRKNQSDEFSQIIRHEMTHSNDTKFNMINEDLDNTISKYEKEMKEAGISDYYIEYAHTDKREFIAVAAQGDVTKYSDDFKKVLIDNGMPEWFFNIN